MALIKSRLNIGLIIGENSHNFLSFDEYAEHFLLPFSPRFCNIDFSISSLNSIGIKHIVIFVRRDKDIVLDYLVRGWPDMRFYVFDYIDIKEKFTEFLSDFSKDYVPERVIIMKGNYPIWFHIDSIKPHLLKSLNVGIKTRYGNKILYCGLVLDMKIFLRKYESFFMEESSLDVDLIEKIVKEFSIPSVEANGYVMPFNSLREYYDVHMGMIKDYLTLDKFNAYIPVRGNTSIVNSSMIGKGAHVKNIIFGENVEINGVVENSVIFSNVKIRRHAIIKNSLILPGNHIGSNAVIINSIIDEYSGDSSQPNIESHAVIGSESASRVNDNFSEILNFGVTLIGKDVRIPSGLKVGANCFIDSFVSYPLLKSRKVLRDGSSILNKGNN